jgi:DNA-binding NtrC family response regulator
MTSCLLNCEECKTSCILEDRLQDPITVFILDDEKNTNFLVKHVILRSFPNAKISMFTDSESMLKKVTADEPVILVTDFFPPINGEQVIKEVRKKNEDALIIVMSATENRKEMMSCIKSGANNFINKINISTISYMLSSHLAARHSDVFRESAKSLQMA